MKTQLAKPKTTIAKPGDVEQRWLLVDASEKILGRLASEIATILMGKHRPMYTPHIDTGDYVVVTNVEKIALSGKKWEQKKYTWYTGYPGQRSVTAKVRHERQPELILREAVRRMLPKSKLGRAMLDKLKIYTGTEHPHLAQRPEPTELASPKMS
jgi:large subunit ribosomal protein L13